MDLTPKEQAEQRRKIADAYGALADAFEPLHHEAAKSFRVAAESHRKEADRIDPPQPAWQDGDLVRDCDGNLWEYAIGLWRFRGISRSTETLTRDYGPIRKVHLADPARREVVVSLDGIDREELDRWAPEKESEYGAPSQKIAIRAAKAAREQLGEVQ